MAGAAGFDVQVRVEGELDPAWWSAVVGGLTVTASPDGTTLLAVRLVDQGAVHGLLAAVRDLGLSLVSVAVTPTEADPTG